MKTRLLITIIALANSLFMGCISGNKTPTSPSIATPITLPGPTTELLFPDGTYKQNIEVKINIPDKDVDSDFSFQAAIKKQPEKFVMLAYSDLGISLFRIEDSPPQPLQWTCEVDIINKNKAFFFKIYPQIKQIFTLKGRELKVSQNKFYWNGENFKIDFVSFTPQGRPILMNMSDQKHYWVQIKNIYD